MTSFKELDVNGMFSLKDEADKIVDFNIGTTSEKPVDGEREGIRGNLLAVVTESGKCYGRGSDLFDSLKYNNRAGSADDCFEIKMTDGKVNYLAKKVFLNQKQTLIWLSAEDTNTGKWTTIGAGDTDAFHGINYRGNDLGKQKPLKKLNTIEKIENCFFTKIVSTKYCVFAIDSEKNLWLWGYPQEGESEDLFDKKANKTEGGLEKPSRVKWFRDKGLDVIDVATSLRSGIVRTRAEDGTEAFYGIPYIAMHDEDDDEEGNKGMHEET